MNWWKWVSNPLNRRFVWNIWWVVLDVKLSHKKRPCDQDLIYFSDYREVVLAELVNVDSNIFTWMVSCVPLLGAVYVLVQVRREILNSELMNILVMLMQYSLQWTTGLKKPHKLIIQTWIKRIGEFCKSKILQILLFIQVSGLIFLAV